MDLKTLPDVRATILSDLDKAGLKGLPTHNITAERKLAVFDKRAGKVGKCRSYKFTAKSVRNDRNYIVLNKGQWIKL